MTERPGDERILTDLLPVARAIAADIHRTLPSDEALLDILRYVLLEPRQYLACYLKGILTFEELSDVVAAHLVTLAERGGRETLTGESLATSASMQRLQTVLARLTLEDYLREKHPEVTLEATDFDSGAFGLDLTTEDLHLVIQGPSNGEYGLSRLTAQDASDYGHDLAFRDVDALRAALGQVLRPPRPGAVRLLDVIEVEVVRAESWGLTVRAPGGALGHVNLHELDWGWRCLPPPPVGTRLQVKVMRVTWRARGDGVSFFASARALHPELNPWARSRGYLPGQVHEARVALVGEGFLLLRLSTGALARWRGEVEGWSKGQALSVRILEVDWEGQKLRVEPA